MQQSKKNYSESSHQQGFLIWFKNKFPDIFIYHIPNEGKRSVAMNTRLIAEGLVPGMPDLHIPQWSLWIEMKKPGGRLSPAQKETIMKLQHIGQTVIIGYGATDASKKVLDYLKTITIE